MKWLEKSLGLCSGKLILFIRNKSNIQQYITDFDVHKQKLILAKTPQYKLKSNFIRGILAKVVLFKDKVEIIICKDQLIKGLEYIATDTDLITESKHDPENPIKITKEIRISTTSRNGSVLIVNNPASQEVNVNPFLVKIIAKSYYWNKLIAEGKARYIKDIQKMENYTNHNYIKELLRLKFLAPDIVEKILNGTQPKDLTADKLRKIKTLDWQEQRKILNF